MCEDEINIGVTEIVNTILVEAQPNDQVIDINVSDNTENVAINCTPNLIEVNINTGVGDKSVVVVDTIDDLPLLGETETLYLALDTKFLYIWDNVNEEYSLITDYIPYLGAIKNANLGEYGLKAGWLGLDLTPTNTPTTEGTISWNSSDGTADLKLKGGNVTLQVGQEEVVRVVNKTGATLNEADFRAVRIRSVAEGGAQGQRLAVVLAQANNDANSATTIGLVTESISNNAEGFITTFGNVSEIDTTGAKSWGGSETWVDGDMLYLSSSHAGYLTNVKPSAPDHLITIGYVVYAHAVHGKIFVKVDNGYELDELHNVQISSATNNDILAFNSATSVWQNKTLSALVNGSLVPSTRTITINGQTYDLSANRSWTITSMIYPSAGIAVSTGSAWGTSITDNSSNWNTAYGWGNHALAGYLTSISSGNVTSALGYTPVPNSRTITINGTTYDLTSDRSWTISASSLGAVGGSGTTNYIPKWSNSSTLTNSKIFDNGLSVGINTITPIAGASLQVDGHIYSKGGAVWTEDGQGFLIGDLNAGASYAFISGVGSTGAASYLTFHTNYYEKMRLTSAGRLGIGMTNPLATLHVTGSTAINDGGLNIDDGYQLVFAQYGNTEYASIEGGSWSSTTNYLRFMTTALERMRIIANGNIGIGLTNPAYKLDVAGDVNITGTFRVNGTPFSGGTTLNGTGFVKASGTTITYDNSTYYLASNPNGYTSNTGTITGSGSTNSVVKFTGASSIGNGIASDNGSTFSVSGAITATGDITAYSSDIRLKENIVNIPNALDKILSLNGVTYDWNEKALGFGFVEERLKHDVGLLAQQVESVLPEAIAPAPFDTNSDTGKSISGENYLTIRYDKLSALFVEGFKEQQIQIESQQKEIEELKKLVNQLLSK